VRGVAGHGAVLRGERGTGGVCRFLGCRTGLSQKSSHLLLKGFF
jgi:hypothetical protein